MYILFLKPRLLTPRPVLLWGQQVPGGGPTTTTLRQACWEPTATRRPGMVMEPRKAYVWGHTIQLLLIQGSAQRLLLHPHRLSWPTWDGFKNKTYSTWSLNVRNMKVFISIWRFPYFIYSEKPIHVHTLAKGHQFKSMSSCPIERTLPPEPGKYFGKQK